MADDYDGVIDVSPYALRHSGSWPLKCYVLVDALTTDIVSLFVVFGLVVLISMTTDVPGGSLTLPRSLYALVGLFVVAPLVAPILSVAHRHRCTRSKPRYDLSLAFAGFVSILSVYMGPLASVPVKFQMSAELFTVDPVTVSALISVVRLLYDLPAPYGLVPPVAYAADIYGIHRLLR